MRIFLQYPSLDKLNKVLLIAKSAIFSYEAKGASRSKTVEGFDNDDNKIFIGEGKVVWDKAKTALLAWQQFPPAWTKIHSPDTPLKEDETVLVLFSLFGFWWSNPARIVYTINNENQFGFAYGTLDGHVERGEELFCIEQDEDGKIYYRIRAFSKPRFWGARLLYPIARSYQRKFVRESMNRMKALAQ